MRVSTRQSVRTLVINVYHRLFYSRFGATADDILYTSVLFLRSLGVSSPLCILELIRLTRVEKAVKNTTII